MDDHVTVVCGQVFILSSSGTSGLYPEQTRVTVDISDLAEETIVHLHKSKHFIRQ